MESSLCLFMMFKRLLFLLSCLYLITMRTNSSSTSMQPQCHEDESSALLQFKHSFIINKFNSGDPSAYSKVESWKPEDKHGDCCSWDGVECDEITGHVTGLDLSSSFLYGSINSNSSLFNLVHLQRLNLADNNFNYSEIPSRIGHLSRLTTLNLSQSAFVGQIPSEISGLSNLASLDLSLNMDSVFFGHGLLKLEKPCFKSFVRNLTNLKELHLAAVNIYSEVPDALANFSSLIGLSLSHCGLYGEFPRGIFLLPKLQFLRAGYNINLTVHFPDFHHSSPLRDLSINGISFSGELPGSIGNLESLNRLDVSQCNLSGILPPSLSNLTQLSDLDLSENQLVNQIPSWLMNLTQLTFLDLQSNQLKGPIPRSFCQLKLLEYLDLTDNNLSGTVDLDIFLNLRNLFFLQLSFNKLTVLTKNNTNATLPNLNVLGLAACNLKEFPDFLKFQDELFVLILEHNEIHGQIPTWMWNSSRETMTLFWVSHNLLTGFDHNPAIIPWRALVSLDLSHNMLQGSLPIPLKSTNIYNVAGNMLSGEIPLSICHNSNLYRLDLSSNNLSGTIPKCLATLTGSLLLLNLSGNSFQGTIPEMFMTDSDLKMIDLSRNRLQGQVPRTLANCTKLQILVLANNQVDDTFPVWLGALPELQVLILRHNKFHGSIESPNTDDPEFPKLRIIDLSHNGFSGNLRSEYFEKWKAMKAIDVGKLKYLQATPRSQVATQGSITMIGWSDNYNYSITIANKGTQRVYEKIQSAFVAIDLSSNKFRGKIPKSMGNLKGLQLLNLSNNEIIGHIPSSMGNLMNLESLDLSQNMLSGNIPQQLTQLTFLAVLDVSYNHLTGPIPQGAQFDTFDIHSFEGNSGLCGKPLSKKCGNSEASPPPPSTFRRDKDTEFPTTIDWIVIMLGYGSGLTVGLVIGHSLTARHHEWFVEAFERRRQNGRRGQRS